MTRKLTILIEAGESTCASAPGKFCKQVYTKNFGTMFFCHLFNRELRDDKGQLSGEGWLQRLPECLSADEETFASRLRLALDAAKMTPRELARLVEVIPSTAERWMSGATVPLKGMQKFVLAKLKKLAKPCPDEPPQ